MSPVNHALLSVWLFTAIMTGVGVGIFLDDLLGRTVTLPARFFGGLVAAIAAPMIVVGFLVRGARDLHRAMWPEKVELPEARVIK